MCGITGWVDFERDLTAQRPVLDAMTRTQLCRGPDMRRRPPGAARRARPPPPRRDRHRGRHPAHDRRARRPRTGRPHLQRRGLQPPRAARRAGGGFYHRFRTRSDTEVVLHAYLEWGEGLAERLNGMFAFAVWDSRRQELLLVRDRMGVKPLHYFRTPHGVVFGSEAKAVLAHPDVRAVVDLDGLREMLAVSRTPGRTVYRGIAEVRPGHVVRVRSQGVTTRRYWALEAREHTHNLETTVATVRALLEDIVHRQLEADVPLCSLLSGGLDSSAVTAIAARALRTAGSRPGALLRGRLHRPERELPGRRRPVHPGRPLRADAGRARRRRPPRHRAGQRRAHRPGAALRRTAGPGHPRRLRRHGRLAAAALPGRAREVHRGAVRRVSRRAVRRLPLVPRPEAGRRRRLPVGGRGHPARRNRQPAPATSCWTGGWPRSSTWPSTGGPATARR